MIQTNSRQTHSLGGRSNSASWCRFRIAGMAALGFALSAALGCATPTPPPKPGPIVPYRVGAPDQLFVSILPPPVVERAVVVRPDGMITIDLVGDIRASGRTVEEIARNLEVQIARFKHDPKATVSLTSAASTAVTVLGEVAGPSSFPLLKETSVADAIGQVGGVSLFASSGRIRVIRSRGADIIVYRVNLPAIQQGDLSTNIVLAKGDIIYVPPTLLARFGYAVHALLFPFSPLLGVANSLAGNAILP